MKTGKKIKNSCSKKTYNSLKFSVKITPDYDEYKKVILAINKLRASLIVETEEGMMIPNNLGRWIILKNKPRVKNVYSMTRPGTRIHNLHSFGWIYRVYHKERILMRYPELYKFRPHRANIKVPLYNHIMNGTKDYYRQTDFIV